MRFYKYKVIIIVFLFAFALTLGLYLEVESPDKETLLRNEVDDPSTPKDFLLRGLYYGEFSCSENIVFKLRYNFTDVKNISTKAMCDGIRN